jgi:ATP-dependent Clp endopeptidase proteolytic subunit ClpP
MSPGGDIYHAFAIYDAMKTMSKEGYKIEATVEGCAASAAAMIILQAADFRKSMENARFLLHEARRWVFMTVERGSDVEDEHKELQALHKIMFDILAHRTGKSYEAIAKVIQRREIWMSAKEAKEFGLIDEIV